MDTLAAAPEKRLRLSYVLRIVVVITVALLILIPILLGFSFMSIIVTPFCGGGFDPATINLAHENVTFPSAEFDRPTPAYFVPAEDPNGGTVIVLPTGNSARGDRIGDMLVYHEAGFHVLSYSSRVCVGGAMGTLGDREADQVGDALAYLATREDVDAERIGIHGFSAGGAAAILAGARFENIRAVVAEGNYEDFPAQVDANIPSNLGILSPFFRFGAQMAYRLATGNDWTRLSPISVIASIAPRRVLLVYGLNEPGLSGGRHMRDISYAEFLELPGVGHGNYLDVDPELYCTTLADFMRRGLGIAGNPKLQVQDQSFKSPHFVETLCNY